MAITKLIANTDGNHLYADYAIPLAEVNTFKNLSANTAASFDAPSNAVVGDPNVKVIFSCSVVPYYVRVGGGNPVTATPDITDGGSNTTKISPSALTIPSGSRIGVVTTVGAKFEASFYV